MHSRSILWLGITLLAGMMIIVTTSPGARSVRNAHQAEETHVPILTEQLAEDSGIALQCGSGRLSAPNSLESYTCVITNRTSERVRSFSVIFTIVAERKGEELRTSRFTAYDMLIHPDFNDPHGGKSIPPGGEYAFSPAGPTTIEDVVIKRLEVKLDHVELQNGNTLGPNEGGLNIVTRRREGAVKFRQWLKQNYREKGKSVNAIITLIQQTPDSLPGVGFSEAELTQGAEMYRMLLLKRYNTYGIAWLKQILDK
jgi:hypothetical protein